MTSSTSSTSSYYDYVQPQGLVHLTRDPKARSSYDYYSNLCETLGAQILPGYTINYQKFSELLPMAVARGYVSSSDADYVLRGLKEGFDLDLDESKMKGRRVFRNYRSALENRQLVTDALAKRVKSGKTFKLGPWDGSPEALPVEQGCNVPMGAVPKKLEPDSIRPVSDHTKTGFNRAVDLRAVEHTLDTYNEISRELREGYYMRVEDVDGAFPILPLAPRVWKYMFVHWFDIDKPLDVQTAPNTMYVHTFGDFGTSPMPGVWDKFFRCVKAMARVAGALTLPMPHFVDDNSLIGPDQDVVDAEAAKLGAFLVALGVHFKQLKSRPAALKQLVLGFWWDSVQRTRTLETHKLDAYLAHLRKVADSKYITLNELQVLSGRMQRAALTLPPKATVYLANVLLLMRGLKLPWHRRRISRAARNDIKLLAELLSKNLGRGYFCYDHFLHAPDLYTDAAKETRRAGGGYFSMCGAYDHWVYGSATSRQPIDYLEGDAVLVAAEALGPSWRARKVVCWIDNQSFQKSFVKGYSRAERLSSILRKLFTISAKYDCVFIPRWLPSADNELADALSRGKLQTFFSTVSKQFDGDIYSFSTSYSGARRES